MHWGPLWPVLSGVIPLVCLDMDSVTDLDVMAYGTKRCIRRHSRSRLTITSQPTRSLDSSASGRSSLRHCLASGVKWRSLHALTLHGRMRSNHARCACRCCWPRIQLTCSLATRLEGARALLALTAWIVECPEAGVADQPSEVSATGKVSSSG